MGLREQGLNLEKEKSIEALQKRLNNLCTKFGVDPNEDINYGDLSFMLRASKSGSKEFFQIRLGILEDMLQDAILGGEYYKQAEETLKSLEEIEPLKVNTEEQNKFEALQKRVNNLCTKFGVDPNEDIKYVDMKNSILRITELDPKERIRINLIILNEMFQNGYYDKQAEETLRSLEEVEPTE